MMAPGNVRLRRVLAEPIDIEPTSVDTVLGRVETPLRTLGRYQVVRGPMPHSLADYRQAIDTTVTLADGFAFAVEAVPAASPFALTCSERWRITGPGVDDVFYFDGGQLRGRESLVATWREVWHQPYDVWTFTGALPPPPSLTTTTSVEVPIGSLPLGGSMTVWGLWAWADPRPVADRLFFDVIQVRVALAWHRADLGVGQRMYSFWFAPGVGLLALAEDGLVRVRTSL